MYKTVYQAWLCIETYIKCLVLISRPDTQSLIMWAFTARKYGWITPKQTQPSPVTHHHVWIMGRYFPSLPSVQARCCTLECGYVYVWVASLSCPALEQRPNYSLLLFASRKHFHSNPLSTRILAVAVSQLLPLNHFRSDPCLTRLSFFSLLCPFVRQTHSLVLTFEMTWNPFSKREYPDGEMSMVGSGQFHNPCQLRTQ